MEVFKKLKIYDATLSLTNGLAITLAVVLSLCTAYVMGNIFKRILRLGPIIVGVGLGAAFVMISLSLVEMLSSMIITEVDVGFWATVVLISIGGFFGAYLGYRLAYVILIAT